MAGCCGLSQQPFDLHSITREQVRELYRQCLSLNDGRLIVHGMFARADAVNTNRRSYPKHLLEREVARYQRQHVAAGTALGELDHPSYSSEFFRSLNLPNVSHQVLRLKWRGRELWGAIEVLPTPSGLLLWELYSRGCLLGVSSRSWASLVRGRQGGVTVGDDMRLITFDFVVDPSNSGAYLAPLAKRFRRWVPDQMRAVQIAHLGVGSCDMATAGRLPAPHLVLGAISQMDGRSAAAARRARERRGEGRGQQRRRGGSGGGGGGDNGGGVDSGGAVVQRGLEEQQQQTEQQQQEQREQQQRQCGHEPGWHGQNGAQPAAPLLRPPPAAALAPASPSVLGPATPQSVYVSVGGGLPGNVDRPPSAGRCWAAGAATCAGEQTVAAQAAIPVAREAPAANAAAPAAAAGAFLAAPTAAAPAAAQAQSESIAPLPYDACFPGGVLRVASHYDSSSTGAWVPRDPAGRSRPAHHAGVVAKALAMAEGAAACGPRPGWPPSPPPRAQGQQQQEQQQQQQQQQQQRQPFAAGAHPSSGSSESPQGASAGGGPLLLRRPRVGPDDAAAAPTSAAALVATVSSNPSGAAQNGAGAAAKGSPSTPAPAPPSVGSPPVQLPSTSPSQSPQRPAAPSPVPPERAAEARAALEAAEELMLRWREGVLAALGGGGSAGGGRPG